MLGAKKIPKYDGTQAMPIYKENMSIIGVGVKDDYILPSGVEGI